MTGRSWSTSGRVSRRSQWPTTGNGYCCRGRRVWDWSCVGLCNASEFLYPIWVFAAAVFLWRQQLGERKFLAKPEQPKPVGQLALPGGSGTLELRQTTEGAAFVVDRQGYKAVAIRHRTFSRRTVVASEKRGVSAPGAGIKEVGAAGTDPLCDLHKPG